ncbi:hypothetical protein DL93DRAFT_2165825 [Clavulina sp. PMI_390]|nr:hypothetical protein DL93DRAFT_2165825 [Clavulina sp. PMI_390]
MTTLDPAHIPSRHDHRGQAVTRLPTSRGRKGPPIPDLRFEQSYLLSIQSFISFPAASTSTKPPKSSNIDHSVGRHESMQTSEKLGLVDSGDSGQNEVIESLYGVPLDIRWRGVAWVTIRDQIISPLVQGALWAVIGISVAPLVNNAGKSIRALFGLGPQRRPAGSPSSQNEMNWFRRWVRSFYTGVQANTALAR